MVPVTTGSNHLVIYTVLHYFHCTSAACYPHLGRNTHKYAPHTHCCPLFKSRQATCHLSCCWSSAIDACPALECCQLLQCALLDSIKVLLERGIIPLECVCLGCWLLRLGVGGVGGEGSGRGGWVEAAQGGKCACVGVAGTSSGEEQCRGDCTTPRCLLMHTTCCATYPHLLLNTRTQPPVTSHHSLVECACCLVAVLLELVHVLAVSPLHLLHQVGRLL